MNLANLTLPDLVGALISFTFTIIIFSYILGDNPLFRLVTHIFIGVSAGFAAGMIFYNVILDQLIFPLFEKPAAAYLYVIPPLLMGIWLLAKLNPGLAHIGNPVMAYLVGVGAATAVGGAVLGTVFPQITGLTSLFDLQAGFSTGANIITILAKGLLILAGTVSALAYFQFGVKSSPNQMGTQSWMDTLRLIGEVFIAITFGYVFAGVYSAALTALIERGSFIVNILQQFLPGH